VKLHLISLLLTSVSVSAHLGYSHHEPSKEEMSKAVSRRIQAVLPVKTNQSTIDWDQDDQPFRLGDHEFKTLKEFKESGARCGCRDPPKNERIASQEKVEAYVQAHPEEMVSNSTRHLQARSIPVYFNCITSGSTGECSSSLVDQQIAILNAAYSPTFSFDLVSAKSYNRPEYYNCSMSDKAKERRTKEEFHQGGMNGLNLYTCNPDSGTLGWATFPDGSEGGGSNDV
jgi:hypothetical protein